MNAALLSWVASVAGAGLFFSGGFFAAARRALDKDSGLADQLDQLRRQAEEKDQKIAALLKEMEEQEEADFDIKTVKVEVEAPVQRAPPPPQPVQASQATAPRAPMPDKALLAKVSELESELNSLRKEHITVKDQLLDSKKDRSRLVDELNGARKQIDILTERSAMADERQDLVAKVEVLKRKEAEVEELNQVIAALREKVEKFEAQVEHSVDMEELEKVRHDLAVKTEVYNSQAKDMERILEEQATMRASLEDLESLKLQVEHLKKELGDARADKFVATEPPKTRPSLPASGIHGQALQALLNKVGSLDPVRSSVITDEHGFVVAGTGEHSESLGALGAFLVGVGSKARELLPFKGLRVVSLRDDNNVSICAWPLATEHSELVLATLTVGAEPEGKVVNELIERVPRIGL